MNEFIDNGCKLSGVNAVCFAEALLKYCQYDFVVWQ